MNMVDVYRAGNFDELEAARLGEESEPESQPVEVKTKPAKRSAAKVVSARAGD